MPAVTYLSDHEVRRWASVPDDKDCNEILQELRALTGDNWLVGVRTYADLRPFRWWKNKVHRVYTLYADCHGEWQVINLVGPHGGTVFHANPSSREAVMNFMLGMIAGWHDARKRATANA